MLKAEMKLQSLQVFSLRCYVTSLPAVCHRTVVMNRTTETNEFLLHSKNSCGK